MSNSLGRKLFFLLALSIAVGIVISSLLSERGWQRRRYLKLTLEQLQILNKQKEAEAQILKNKIKALRTRRDVQEHTIRGELDFIKPNEIILSLDEGP